MRAKNIIKHYKIRHGKNVGITDFTGKKFKAKKKRKTDKHVVCLKDL